MRKTYLLFLLFFNTLLSQTVKVEYDYTVDMSGSNLNPFKHKLELTNSQGKSLLKKYLSTKPSEKLVDKNDQQVKVIKIGNDTTFVYKEFENNKLYSEEKIFIKMFQVKDSLKIFDWIIENDTTSILGYKCYKAKTKFRGREFEVFFTNQIPISDGPAKYNGLPGLILKVSILNSQSVYSIEATKIILKDENTVLLNPFSESNCIDFFDFKKKYIKKMDEMQSFNENQGTVVGKTGVEILIDE